MNNFPIIKCTKLSSLNNIKHGFFSRNGGVSEGIYSSLNVGFGSNDSPDNVQQNRDIAMQAINLKSNLHTLYQVHSNKVVTVTDDFDKTTKADAMVTNKSGLALGILTADCTPVLFADPKAKVIGAAHAGWKGAFSGVLENTVNAMQNLGANNIYASIGPTISQASYEVGDEFYQRIIDENKENSKFFIDSIKDGHYMFNLPEYVISKLQKLNLESITNVNIDTYPEENNLFSYRRSCHKNEQDYGRNLSAICIA